MLTSNNFGTNFFPSQLSDTVFRYTFAKTHGREPSAWGLDAQNTVTTLLTDRTRGSLPASAELLSVPGVRVLALKPAEDGNGAILRLKNDTEQDVVTEVSFLGQKARLLCECDVLEREIRPLSGNRITVPAGKLMTVRFCL